MKVWNIKCRSVQGHVFVQITFENCTLIVFFFFFENRETGIKKTIVILQPLLAWNVSACLRIFVHPPFKEKRVFMKLAMFFISSTKRIFTKLLSFSKSSVKIKVRSHGALFLILFQQLFANNDFCMETRLWNIFKTANAMTLTKTILESPYNNCKVCVKELSLTTRTVFNGRSIWGYFYRLNCLNFRLILTKINLNLNRTKFLRKYT